MTCAIEAKKAGLNALLIDKGMLVNTLFHFPTNMTFFSTSILLEIGGIPFVSHDEKPTRRESLEYFRRVCDSWELKVNLYEMVENVKKENDHFKVQTSKNTYQAKDVIIATGFYDIPVLMDVPGENFSKVHHYYNEAHPYVGQKVVVIGAANSACDVALELFHKGVEVTMIIRSAAISDRVKYWIKPNIENRIKEGSIKAYFNSHVTRISENTVEVNTPDGVISMPNDYVLAMTGYQPDFKFLKHAGIALTDDAEPELVYDPITHETSVPGLYVAGVVCGGLRTNKWLIENARDHGEKIMRAIIDK